MNESDESARTADRVTPDNVVCQAVGCNEEFGVIFGDPLSDEPQLALCNTHLRTAYRQLEANPWRLARTDPWRWYCRLCGAEGENADRTVTYEQAMAHVASGQPCGRGVNVGEVQSGRLLHVWTYGRA